MSGNITAPSPLRIAAQQALLEESGWTPSNSAPGHNRMMRDAVDDDFRLELLKLLSEHHSPAKHSGGPDTALRATRFPVVTAPHDLLADAREVVRGQSLKR